MQHIFNSVYSVKNTNDIPNKGTNVKLLKLEWGMVFHIKYSDPQFEARNNTPYTCSVKF